MLARTKQSMSAFLIAFFVGANAAECAAPAPSKAFLARLVEELGDDSLAVREEASRRLQGCEEALGLLESARTSPSPEVRRRASKLVLQMRLQTAKNGLDRIVSLAGAGRVDLLPLGAMAWKEDDNGDRMLRSAAFMAEKLAVKGKRLARFPKPVPITAWGRFPARPLPKLLADRTQKRIAGDSFSDDELRCFLGVCRTLTNTNYVGASILLATEDFRMGGTLSDSLVITGGDIELDCSVSQCVIICGGRVRMSEGIRVCSNSIIIARNGIQAGPLVVFHHCVLSSCGPISGRSELLGTSHVAPNAKCPLGIIRFFETADVGVALDLAATDTRIVKSVTPRSRLARAGLLKGDRFSSIDGVVAKDGEEVRRLLRKRFALGGYGTFVVQRDGKPVTLRARIADDAPTP